jgi:hypothetical protein
MIRAKSLKADQAGACRYDLAVERSGPMRTRAQIFPWLTPSLRKRLRAYAAKRGATESSVVESALLQYLDAETTDRALLLRRLDRVGTGLSTLHRDFDIVSQALGVFFQLWFAHTPRIPDDAKAAAEQIALKRYDQFLDHVAAQIMGGQRFAQEIARDVGPSETAAGENDK